MAQQYLMPKARNRRTGEVVMERSPLGLRIELRQRSLAQQQADRLAEKMQSRTNDVWYGFVDIYLA